MRLKLTRSAAFIGPFILAGTGCLDLGLSPSVGGVLQSVVVEGEALPEFAEATGGTATMRVTGQIVGRLRCDTVEGTIEETDGALKIIITVVSGSQGCNSLTPTTLSYAANIFNLSAGLTPIVVEHRYEGVDGVAGQRLEDLVTIG